MKDVFIELVLGIFLGICFVIFCLVIASVSRSVYSMGVHPHGESVLTDCKFSNGVHSAPCGFFVRKISMRSHVMAELEREAFALASHLSYWSTNPFQLCHLNYLVVIGKAPLNNSGAHSHA